MRTLAILVTLLAAPLVGASDFDAQVALELAKARRLANPAKTSSSIHVVSFDPLRTTCGCALPKGANPFVECECFVGECACKACGSGGAAKSPKVQGSPTTRATPVQAADIPRQPVKELGLSEVTPPVVTYTLVPTAGQAGFTSGGCASGQCPSSTSRRRLMSR